MDKEDSYDEFVGIVIQMAEKAAGAYQIDLNGEGTKLLSQYFYRKKSPLLSSLQKNSHLVNDLEENVGTLIVTAFLNARTDGLSSVGAPHVMNAINILYPDHWPFGF